MVSIILPVYNTEAYLPECIESVLHQTFSDWELICVDDCSKDGSLEVLHRFAEIDSRIKIFSHSSSKGVSAARNTGLRHAGGGFVFFLDSDDFLYPNCLKFMLEKMDENCQAVVFSPTVLTEINNENINHTNSSDSYSVKLEGLVQLDPKKLLQFGVAVWAKLFRMERIKELKLEFPEGLIWEDNYWHWCYFLGTPRVYFDPRPVYVYRQRVGSIMSSAFNYHGQRVHEHAYIASRIIEFYKEHGQYGSAKKALLKMMENQLLWSLQYVLPPENLKVIYSFAKVIENEEILPEENGLLNEIKKGNYNLLLWGNGSDMAYFIRLYLIVKKLIPKGSFIYKILKIFK